MIDVRRGPGQGSPTAQVTTGKDTFAGDVDSTGDAASKELVASRQSLAGKGGTVIRARAANRCR